MINAPDTDMLIRCMGEMQEYGLSGHSHAAAAPRFPMSRPRPGKEISSGMLRSEILFVNDAYDSRKTGIDDPPGSPSVYKLCMGPEFLSFMCDRMKTQPHGHLAIQLAFNFDAPLPLRMNGAKAFDLFFFVIPANTPHQMISPAGRHLTILLDPLSVMGRKLTLLSRDRDRFLAYHRAVIDSVYPRVRTRLADFETDSFLNSVISDLLWLLSDLPRRPMDGRIEKAVARCRINGGKSIGNGDLAAWTALSESRARHLFKEELVWTLSCYPGSSLPPPPCSTFCSSP